MKRLFLTILYVYFVRLFLRIIVGIRYHNKEVLKKNKQFIVVSNHNSHLDSLALMSSLSSSQIANTHPVAAGDYFGQSPIRAFFTRFLTNAILIPRTAVKGGQNPIRMMGSALSNGSSLILFPEGSRGEPEKMQEFKKGIGLVLKMHPEIPFIPVFMKGMGRVLPKGERMFVPFDTYVCFGEPRFCKSTNVDDMVKEIEQSIIDLAENNFVKLKK
jgi:1-acyl-sn-glycerol-3-phosphate acyltransferase